MNLQRTQWRSDTRHARALSRAAGEVSTPSSTPTDAADDILDGRRQLRHVKDAIDHLSEPHRQVLGRTDDDRNERHHRGR